MTEVFRLYNTLFAEARDYTRTIDLEGGDVVIHLLTGEEILITKDAVRTAAGLIGTDLGEREWTLRVCRPGGLPERDLPITPPHSCAAAGLTPDEIAHRLTQLNQYAK
jgi:hypothetical protein